MLFSGKGGVGKTTLAAATAVRLAALGSKVLVMSTDPAHSLSDVFDVQLGPRPVALLPGLEAMEIDAKGMFAEAIEGATGGQEGGALSGILRMASETPGVDEFGAIEVILQAMEHAQHDAVILDTAPTGHTLRLLMLPELLEGWFGKLLEMRRGIARAGRFLRRLIPGARAPGAEEIGHDLEGERRRIGSLREVLTDGNRSQIILVTIPEAMSVLETTRTLEMLSGHDMPVGTIFVNQLQPASDSCPHCSRRRRIHLAELERMRRIAGVVPVRVIESLPTEIRGFEALRAVGDLAWGGALRS
jgi:arsenite/tail-anchored protein-transporting ATPase